MKQGSRGFTLRATFIGLCFATLGVCVNTYLGINFGMGISLGVIAVLVAFSLFSRSSGNESLKEVSIVYLISTSFLQAYWVLGASIYMIERFNDVVLPAWLIPPKEVILAKSLDLRYWAIPLFTLFCLQLISTGLGLIMSLVLGEDLASEERMVFPNIAMSASLIEACFKGGESVRRVAIAIILGLGVTLSIRLLSALTGVNLMLINLSYYLPYGSVLALSLNLGFMAMGYIISASVSLSLMASGLVLYLLLLPILSSKGMVSFSYELNELYNSLIFGFSASPALGMLLIGSACLSLLAMLERRLMGAKSKKELGRGFGELYRVMWNRILRNKGLLYLVTSLLLLIFILAYVLNPLEPFPPLSSLAFVLYSVFLASFLEFVMLTKMAGETGMTMGVLGIMLYDIPVFLSGYRGYSAYLALSYFRPSPWTGPSVVGLIKYKDMLGIDKSDIVKGKLIGWIPTFLLSAALTLLLWKNLGFGTSTMPSLGLLQTALYVRMLATGSLTGGGTLDPRSFILGGLIGALLEVLTPMSMMGLAIGLLLPPHYVTAMGIGGLVRLYTDRRYGKEYFREKGLLISTGLMASSMIADILMSMLFAFA